MRNASVSYFFLSNPALWEGSNTSTELGSSPSMLQQLPPFRAISASSTGRSRTKTRMRPVPTAAVFSASSSSCAVLRVPPEDFGRLAAWASAACREENASSASESPLGVGGFAVVDNAFAVVDNAEVAGAGAEEALMTAVATVSKETSGAAVCAAPSAPSAGSLASVTEDDGVIPARSCNLTVTFGLNPAGAKRPPDPDTRPPPPGMARALLLARFGSFEPCLDFTVRVRSGEEKRQHTGSVVGVAVGEAGESD